MVLYTSVIKVKEASPGTPWTAAHDTFLGDAILRASQLIDTYTLRPAGSFLATVDSVRYFSGSGDQELWIPDLASIPTTLAVAETGLVDTPAGTGGTYTTWALTDYFLWPDEGPPFMRIDINTLTGAKGVWPTWPRAIKITGKWGYSTTVPADVEQACIAQVMRWLKRGQQGYQDTGAIVELGQLRYTKALDPEVTLLLDHYLVLGI